MKKILFILAFIPLLIFGQGTQNLTVKRVKTDSIYIQKLASVSSSNIVLVLDSLTGKIGKRPYPAGGGDSYWQELTGNLANIDTTTGFYVNSTSGVKNTNLSMYPASSWWRIEQSNRTTGVQSVAQGSAGVVSLQANAGGAVDVVQVNGAGYLYGRTGSNGLNLGSSTYRWGLLYPDSINTRSIYATSQIKATTSSSDPSIFGQKTGIGNAVQGMAKSGAGGWFRAETGVAVYGYCATGNQFQFGNNKDGTPDTIMVMRPNGYVGIGKTNPSTALDVTGVITATGGTSTDWNNAAGWVTTNGANVSNWNTAYGWGNHAGLYIPLPEGGITQGDIWYGGDTQTQTISKPTGEDNYTLKWMGGSGGTPSWQSEEWTKTGTYTVRQNRVGIGVDSPLYWLHIGGAVKSDTNIAPLVLGGTAVSSSLTLKSTSGTGSSDYINFVTGSGTEAGRWTTNGRLGIGTTNPGYPLQVVGDVYTSATLYLSSGNCGLNSNELTAIRNGAFKIQNTSTGASSAMSFSTKNTEAIRIDPSQRVGIGTTAPAAKLHVAGGIMLDGTDTTGVGSSAKVGTIQYYNGNFYGLKAGTPPTWVQLNN